MSIRAVDLMRTQETSQIKQVEYNRSQSEQAQINSQFQQMVEKKGQQTTDVAESETPEFRYDAKEQGNNSYSNNKENKKKKKKGKEKSKEPIKPGNFDVSI
ncbi:MAG TPA: hypothetical protein GXZ90_09590 [Clostridiales bacterium]|nr:hypothetical protein [Clostridiales bacterium]